MDEQVKPVEPQETHHGAILGEELKKIQPEVKANEPEVIKTPSIVELNSTYAEIVDISHHLDYSDSTILAYEIANKIPPEAVRARMEENFQLIQNIDSINPEEPAMTICIPVALGGEDPAMLAGIVEQLQRAAKGIHYEVLFWINATADTIAEQDIQEAYAKVISAISQVEHPQLTLRAALQIFDKDTLSISKIRGNYMEAVAIDAEHRGFTANHPVLWLDADTTFVTQDSLGKIVSTINTGDANFVHANLQFSAEWSKGTPIEELDDATKAIIFNEIFQRKKRRGRAGDVRVRSSYIEESGLAFSLGTYLSAGGVDRKDPINESANLIYRFSKNVTKDTPWPKKPERIRFIKEARIGTSARRHKELVKKYGVKSLIEPERTGYTSEGLFTEMMKGGADKPITREDMERLLRAKGVNFTEIYESILRRLFPDVDDNNQEERNASD